MPALKAILYQMMKQYTKKLWSTRYVIASLLLINSLALQGQVPPSREYQLKAVFLFNFTQFVEWPASSFSSDQSPMIIGIVGNNPFGSYLEETVTGEKVGEHPVVVQYYNNAEEIKACHILFINLSDSKQREQVVTLLKGRNILMVSDAPGFLNQGGMVRFFTGSNKIKLQINLEAAKAANLSFSSKLLRLAEIFKPRENN
jgi:hypothetical protein